MPKVRFTSKFPFCTMVMKYTSVMGYKLRFPRKFSKQIPASKKGTMLFEGEYGKQWPVKYYDDGYGERSSIVVNAGWMYLVKDSHLKIGDTCGFELLPDSPYRIKTTIRVTIFRKSSDDYDSDSDSDAERASPYSNLASNGRKLFQCETSRFFRIIHQECVERGTLLIPKKFGIKHQNDLPNQVLLSVPSGAVWKVEVVRRENELWLEKGWRAFQQYYSIVCGSFLVFQYKGGSLMEVTVFDTTTSEIEYPYDDNYEEPEPYETSKKRKRDDNGSVDPQPPKMARTTFSSYPMSKSKLNVSNSAKRGNAGISSQKHGQNNISKSSKVSGNTRTLKTENIAVVNSQNNSRDFKETAVSKSKRPSFVIVMRPTYLCGYYAMMPFSFASIHLKQQSGSVIFQTSKTETWTVSYKIYSHCRVSRLKTGWSAFVEANDLRLGDECIFKLINPAECRFKVVIVRARNEKLLALPAPKEKCLGRETRSAIRPKSSAAELQTCVPPVAAQSIRIKTEDSS